MIDLINGASYYYTMIASNDIGASNQSMEFSATLGQITAPPIVISGDSQFASCPWMNGTGTWGDPYVFNFLTIAGSNSGSKDCISISDTTMPCVIENCLFSMDGGGVQYYIRLNNVTNVIVFNNTLSGGQTYFAIGMTASTNVTIDSNTISLGLQADIALTSGCTNNIIVNNTCEGYGYNGIYLLQSDNNTIEQNFCPGHDNNGIYAQQSSNLTIENNNCFENVLAGISLQTLCDNCLISGNNCTGNNAEAILINNCYYETIMENFCTTDANEESSAQGISLESSSFDSITSNICPAGPYGQYGIYLDGLSNFNMIANNLCQQQTSVGIYLDSATNPCTNNTITNNTCIQNYDGIDLYSSCDSNILNSNNCSLNTNDGIYLYQTSFNLLIGNNCSMNSQGILLGTSSTNVTLNTCAKNELYGIFLDAGSTFNTVTQNWLKKNVDNLVNDGTNNVVAPNFIISSPIADFSPNPTSGKPGEPVTFTDTTMGGDLPLAYQWNFGDGSINSTAQNTIHTFLMAGNYNITLTVIDADGDISISNDTYTVLNVPVAPGLYPITPSVNTNGTVVLYWSGVNECGIL